MSDSMRGLSQADCVNDSGKHKGSRPESVDQVTENSSTKGSASLNQPGFDPGGGRCPPQKLKKQTLRATTPFSHQDHPLSLGDWLATTEHPTDLSSLSGLSLL